MDPLPPRVASTLEMRLRERHVYGAAVAAFDRDGLCFAGGAGYADIQRGEPATVETVFRVASVSKLLTATLALTLADAGELDLDAAVNRSLPAELQITDDEGAPTDATLAHLLSHSSGLPSGVRGATMANPVTSLLANGGRVRTLTDAITRLRTVRNPGERVVYSNPAFNVAGYVAARSVGRPFEVASHTRVLAPLGMAASAFGTRSRGPGVATPYGSLVPPKASAKPADAMRLVATPMGGLTTNVVDLTRFGRMVLGQGTLDGHTLIGRDLLERATTLQARNHPGLDQGFGLGFKVRTWRGRTLVGHDGNMPGVSAQLLLSPEDGVGVVVLTNGFALSVPHETAAMCLEHLLGLDPSATPAGAGPVTGPDAAAWEALGRRIEGRLRLVDAFPPGVVGRLAALGGGVHATHEVGGRLRIDGSTGWDGPAWLLPDGELGRYRIAASIDHGTSAVVDAHPAGGTDLWLGYTTHLTNR